MATNHGQHFGGNPAQAGRDEIDAEHHVQVGLLYALREAVTHGQAENAEDLLDRLVDYSTMHFASEQLLMRLYQYDEFERHVAEHEQMIETLQDLRARQQAGEAFAVERGLDELDAGLLSHIRGADRNLGRYLARLPEGAGRER